MDFLSLSDDEKKKFSRRPLDPEHVQALINSAVQMHSAAISQQKDKRWWVAIVASLAGVVLASKINVASGRIGINTPLLVITAVLLGGISLSGGEGSISKAFQGILLIGILNNAMVLLRISPFIQDMIRGLLLIIMLVVDAINIRRSKYI